MRWAHAAQPPRIGERPVQHWRIRLRLRHIQPSDRQHLARGGASNTGGAVIRALIGDERLSSLTARFAPDQPRPPPVVETMQALSDQRSMENAVFFQALLVGITRTEQLAYGRPVELGAPQLALVRSVGEGARSANWTSRREKALGVRFCQPAWPKRRPTRPCWSSTP